MPDLTGKVAVITGGAAGIGGGVSRRLAELGAQVIVNDIDESLLTALVTDVPSARSLVGDITEQSVVEELAALAGDGIDILVNNVGDYRPSAPSFKRSAPDQWQRLYELNLRHVFSVTHALLPLLRSPGSIVNVSTVEALRGIPTNAVYSAFNAGVIAFTRSLAVEVANKGIRVNAIAPDMADTLQTPAESMLRGRDPALVASWIPLGRFGQPVDYADVVAFLASEESRFVTGHTIPVDGGTIAASGWHGKASGKGWTNLPDQA